MQLISTALPIIKALESADTVIIDTETSSLYPHRDGKILAGIGVKPLDKEGFYLPVRHGSGNCNCPTKRPQKDPCIRCGHTAKEHGEKGCIISWPDINAPLSELEKLFEALRGKSLIFHNAKFDLAVIWNEEFNLIEEDIYDTWVLWRLISEDEGSYKLKKLAKKYIDPYAGESEIELKSLMSKHHWFVFNADGERQLRYDMIPAQLIFEYCGDDLNYTEGLFKLAMPKIEGFGLLPLLEEEKKVLRALFRMELTGFPIDPEWVQDRRDKITTLQKNEEARCRKVATDGITKILKETNSKEKKAALNNAYKVAQTFDILKADELKTIYHAVGVHSTKVTRKGAESWDASVLLARANKGDRLAASILRYRSLNKIKASYYDNFDKLADPNCTLHCNIIQAGTRTGRMSASEPNLQNLPKQENLEVIWGAEDFSGEMDIPSNPEELSALSEVRGSFIPRPGRGLLLADWSQIELRIFAFYAQERVMKQAFEYGIDIHSLTAYAAFGPQPTDPAAAKRWRGGGKTINFGLVYGMGKKLLAARIDSTEEEAEEFMENYFHRFPRARKFRDSVQEKLRKRLKATCWEHVYFDFCNASCSQHERMRGWITNLWGRRRLLGDYINKEGNRGTDFYKGVNVLVQGSAGDLMRHTLWKLDKALYGLETIINLVVHDEFIFDVPFGEFDTVLGIVIPTMETCNRIKVPLKVDLKWATKRWSDAVSLNCKTCDGLGHVYEIPPDELLKLLIEEKLPEMLPHLPCPQCEGKRFNTKVVHGHL